MSLLRWFAFTETSVEAGKNNESREPKACRLGAFRLLYSSLPNA